MCFSFFCFFLVIFHRDGLDDERAAKIERTSANLVCSNPGPPRQLQGRFLHITDLHPDPLYQPGGAVSTACHRREPEKEKHRAGYLGTPYGFVIFSCSSRSLLFPEALAGNCWICNGMTATESLILFFPRYREDCDSPLSLTNYTLDHLEQHWVKHIDFVICASCLFPPFISILSDICSIPAFLPRSGPLLDAA